MTRTCSRAALPLLAATVALTVAAVVIDLATAGTAARSELGAAWPTALGGLALGTPGALLLRRLPRQPVAWVMALGGLVWAFDAVAGGWAAYAVESGAPGGSAAFFFFQRLGSVLLLPLPLVLLLFPDGRLPTSRLLRVPSLVTVAGLCVYPVVLAVVPSEVAERFHGDSLPASVRGLQLDPVSLALPYPAWRVLLTFTVVLTAGSLLVPLLVLLGRFRRADAERRAQLTWLVLAAVAAAAVMLVSRVLPDGVTDVALPLALALVAAAVLVAVSRYRLYDVDLLVGWTVLYGALAALVVLVDVAVFGLAGSVVSSRESALVATFVVALLYGPLRVRLHLLVQRLVRGRRDDPYAVVSALAERLEDSSDPDGQLLAVVRSVATAFRSSWVRVELERAGGGTVVAEHGVPASRTIALPVSYRGEQIGRLVLAPPTGLRLSDDDQRLLADVVRQAAAAHRTAQLAEELQASRKALVTAREEERRRLRRDLHDGLGPALGAVSLRIETARNLARSEPEQADSLLADSVRDVSDVLADVRRLVHDLRPPALDEVGLLGALEQQAERFRCDALAVEVFADGALDGLPAAVEVAAYRIVSEALANVARHAQASRVGVRLTPADGSLSVAVEDDGVGIDPDAPAGVGLVSLHERAGELGGRVSVGCPDGGGTVITAHLPLVSVPAQRA